MVPKLSNQGYWDGLSLGPLSVCIEYLDWPLDQVILLIGLVYFDLEVRFGYS